MDADDGSDFCTPCRYLLTRPHAICDPKEDTVASKRPVQEFELLVTVTVADEPTYDSQDVEELCEGIRSYVEQTTNDGVKVEAR